MEEKKPKKIVEREEIILTAQEMHMAVALNIQSDIKLQWKSIMIKMNELSKGTSYEFTMYGIKLYEENADRLINLGFKIDHHYDAEKRIRYVISCEGA